MISTDLYPTVLDLAGLALRPQQHRDGVSLAGLLRGVSSLEREALFWHYPHYGNQGGSPASAVRMGDWKLIEFFEDGRRELYHVGLDVSEARDLAAANPTRLEGLARRLEGWRRDVGAALPRPNPDRPGGGPR